MRALIVVIVVTALACQKERVQSGTSGAPSQSAFAAPSAAPQPPSSKPLGTSIGGMLQAEQLARPSGTPRAEDVIAALGKDGVVVEDVKQHLGAPVGAKYCVGGTTKNGVAMSICEYESATAAEAGRATSQKAFGAIEGREIFLRKATTLTMLQSAPTDATRAEVKRAAAALEKL